MNVVSPKWVGGNGLLGGIFSNAKKWTVNCGACEHTWKEKIPLNNIVSAICPACRAQNKWSLKQWFQMYESAREV